MILGLSLNTLLTQAADEDTKPTPTPALPESVKKYDKNGDGKIDKEEQAAMQKARQAEYLKKYDKNGDGKIDEAERQAIIEERKKEREEVIKKRQAELGKEPQKKIEEKK